MYFTSLNELEMSYPENGDSKKVSTLQGCRFIRNPKWCPKNEILEMACVRFYRYIKKDLTGMEKRTMLLQHSTAQHSTAQHSTAQHSTAQHSTAYNCAYFSFICILNRQVKGVSLNSHARRFFLSGKWT